jgi:hypothetical protein
MAHGLRVRDRQHASRGNPGPVLQLGLSEFARDPANCGGCPVWRRRRTSDQCPLAHCMPGFDHVACTGRARNSDHRDGDLRSTHRAVFGKSQIAHRRQTFLSASASRDVDAEVHVAGELAPDLTRRHLLASAATQSAASILLAMALRCSANWIRHRTLHCVLTGSLFLVLGLLSLLSEFQVIPVARKKSFRIYQPIVTNPLFTNGRDGGTWRHNSVRSVLHQVTAHGRRWAAPDIAGREPQ